MFRILELFKFWDWLDTLLLVVGFITVLSLSQVIFVDHKIQCYYIETTPRESGFITYDIKGYRNWWSDSTVFRSLNFEETFKIFKELDNKCTGK